MGACGFVSLAFDPSFGGESGGEVRNVASPCCKLRVFMDSNDASVILEFSVDEKYQGGVSTSDPANCRGECTFPL